MKRIFTKIFTVVLTLIGVQSFAQSVLAPGDIAFVAYQYVTNSPDRFAFVPMVDLQANTTITFTDNAFKVTNVLNNTEDTMVWNSGANVIPAGTIVIIMADTTTLPAPIIVPICNYGSANNELDGLSTGGDQIIAYQGVSTQSPVFIAAISSNSFLTTGTTTSNTSFVPTGLTDQTNAVGFPSNKAAGYYDCINNITTGDPATLLASINDSSNWVRGAALQTWPTCNFSVVTSTKSVKESNVAFKAFPNPSATGVFNLTKNANVQVYNMVGVNVMNAVNTNTLDISGLSAGVYIVKTNNNEMIKIVKSN